MGVITCRHQQNWLLSAAWLKQDLTACRLLPWAVGKGSNSEWQKEDAFIGSSGTHCTVTGEWESWEKDKCKKQEQAFTWAEWRLHGLGNPTALQLKNLSFEPTLKLWEGRAACERVCIHMHAWACVLGWKAETESVVLNWLNEVTLIAWTLFVPLPFQKGTSMLRKD